MSALIWVLTRRILSHSTVTLRHIPLGARPLCCYEDARRTSAVYVRAGISEPYVALIVQLANNG